MRLFLEELERRLAELRAAGLHRAMAMPSGIDFASNDYLGLSREPRLMRAASSALARGSFSAPASRLLRGQTEAHRALEERLARFKGTEAALLFPSGYQANLALLGALVAPEDRVLSDALNHASIVDAIRLARPRKVILPHRDLDALRAALEAEHAGGWTFIVTESLFSMDGELAQLAELARLAREHGALLIVDDAHATGLYGQARGSGLCEAAGIERDVTAIVSTGGKALGLAGAFIAGPRAVIETLVNRARPFIYSTAVPPLLCAALDAAVGIVESEPRRRARALELAGRLRRGLREQGLDARGEESPIVPLILGDNELALAVAARARASGFDVRAVRPPSVPPGTARLRISVHADHSEEEVDRLGSSLVEAVRAEPARVPRGASPPTPAHEARAR